MSPVTNSKQPQEGQTPLRKKTTLLPSRIVLPAEGVVFLLSLLGCLNNFTSGSSEVDNFTLTETLEQEAYSQTDVVKLLVEQECLNPCTLQVETSSSIDSVEYYADDEFFLGFGDGQQEGFPLQYEFQELGIRKIEALGFDEELQLLNWDIKNIEIKEHEPVTSLELRTGTDCQNPCSFSANASNDISAVEYYVDSWLIGTSSTANSNFQITYEFSQVGTRYMLLKGLSENGEVVAQADAWITIEPEESLSLPAVPYFYQYSNSLYPYRSCQNTSIAMLLAYFGWPGVPDDITAGWGKDYTQSPSGLADAFNTIGSNSWITARLEPEYNGTIYGLKAELDAGNPTIVHGFLTNSGHVLIILGYDESGYWVNDPAGQWNQIFGGGYPYGWQPTIGNAIYYDRVAFERAIGTWDGYEQAPLWYHKIR